ncbi:hypothetical protein [Pseudonocardia sp. H11422]|nr:hypothetical protein [Pseudonocardia sp. H11422]
MLLQPRLALFDHGVAVSTILTLPVLTAGVDAVSAAVRRGVR